ncbi:MAG: hypothetical protein E6Q56_03715 [Mycobacterium sp.]|jgi:hypothetical protein|nr:MAG: hypothetical protein E6Q56_03715 [Mycobacterium sp.]HPY24012.1 hypothetical protein [Mycobacterium sp.]
MNIAEEIIDWLYTEHLGVDEGWSYRLPTGFTWWADHYAQTVEILGEETGPNGETGYLVCVRTELLRDLDLTDEALAEINGLPMRCAALAGPVYDVEARMADLWSMVRVTDDNGAWMRYLLGAAAVTQLAEARLLAPVVAEAVGARPATSDHPESGPRTVPDEMSFGASVLAESGDQPSAWSIEEFVDLAGSGAGSADGQVLTAEFPFGKQTSTCRIAGDQPHPLYGNGLLVLQRFPIAISSEAEGIRLALSLNAASLTREQIGYGLGSYAYSEAAVYFSGFIPNALHKPGLLRSLYSSCAARAQRMAALFVDGRWDPETYALDAEVLARRRERKQATMPVIERPMRGCPMMRAKAGGN